MLLQQHGASLLIDNKLSNSIIGTCIASGHLNLFITLLHQSTDLDLGKLHSMAINNNSSSTTIKGKSQPKSLFSQTPFQNQPFSGGLFGNHSKSLFAEPDEEKSTPSLEDDSDNIWLWKYVDVKIDEKYSRHLLIYLIIERDWQGALSLILNDFQSFRLSSIQILEASLLNNKLNLVLRFLLRIKEKHVLHEKNSQNQNLFHLLANVDQYEEDLYIQILLHLHENHLEWNIPDKYGSCPIHYACVKQNFIMINFLQEKYPIKLDLNQSDAFKNTATGLLFWTSALKRSCENEHIRSLITDSRKLNCLCNYDNEIAMNPLSFGYVNASIEKNFYPPIKSDSTSTNVRTSPLINAVVHNNFPLVKFLLQLNADVNFPDEEKQTPLMHAVRQVNLTKSIYYLSN